MAALIEFIEWLQILHFLITRMNIILKKSKGTVNNPLSILTLEQLNIWLDILVT